MTDPGKSRRAFLPLSVSQRPDCPPGGVAGAGGYCGLFVSTFGGGGGGMVITKVTRHGYSFTGIFVYIYFLEVEMPDGGINGGI